jgi:hypothetical protein
LSSNALPALGSFFALAAVIAVSCAAPVAAQDDSSATSTQAEARPRINLMVTVPRGDVNKAQIKDCEDRADAGTISGDIVVCRQVGENPDNLYSGSREEATRRYAQETAFQGSPPTPNVFGIGDNGKGIGFGGVPPPALMIDVGALPKAPDGSDADRIARGLPPLGQEEELSEEQEKARRDAAGIKVAPPARPAAKGRK